MALIIIIMISPITATATMIPIIIVVLSSLEFTLAATVVSIKTNCSWVLNSSQALQ